MNDCGEKYQEILKLVFKKDFAAARRGIESFENDSANQPHHVACLKAYCLFGEGDKVGAFEVLETAMGAGADQYCICRITHGHLAFRSGNYSQAMIDFDMTWPIKHRALRRHSILQFVSSNVSFLLNGVTKASRPR